MPWRTSTSHTRGGTSCRQSLSRAMSNVDSQTAKETVPLLTDRIIQLWLPFHCCVVMWNLVSRIYIVFCLRFYSINFVLQFTTLIFSVCWIGQCSIWMNWTLPPSEYFSLSSSRAILHVHWILYVALLYHACYIYKLSVAHSSVNVAWLRKAKMWSSIIALYTNSWLDRVFIVMLRLVRFLAAIFIGCTFSHTVSRDRSV